MSQRKTITNYHLIFFWISVWLGSFYVLFFALPCVSLACRELHSRRRASKMNSGTEACTVYGGFYFSPLYATMHSCALIKYLMWSLNKCIDPFHAMHFPDAPWCTCILAKQYTKILDTTIWTIISKMLFCNVLFSAPTNVGNVTMKELKVVANYQCTVLCTKFRH